MLRQHSLGVILDGEQVLCEKASWVTLETDLGLVSSDLVTEIDVLECASFSGGVPQTLPYLTFKSD